jgi:RNA-directed DNA polymerase
VSENNENSPKDVSISDAPLARFAQSFAKFLLYSHEHGYALDVNSLRGRAKAHFGLHASLVIEAFREIEFDDASWRASDYETITKRILETKCLAEFQVPLTDDDIWHLEYETLASIEAEHQQRIESAATLAAWVPPLEDAHAWLRDARLIAPHLESASDIADWLDVSHEEFNDALTNKRYRLRTRAKANGGIRLIEIPSERLRVLQRRLLHRLLDRVTPHTAAHAYVHERSVRTHASPHVGKEIVIRLDLEHFFPSVTGARVFLLFRALGFRASIANALTDLCAVSQSRSSLRRVLGQVHVAFFECYSVNHLPQGAPTSPALANLCSYSLDTRLGALAEAFGATYTRYADDLVFSGDGDIVEQSGRFVRFARAIIADEGFRLNTEKTRVMRNSARQSFAGLVVNKHLNIARSDFDRLKAAVHRATRDCSKETEAQLLGRIAWLAQSSPARAKKLREKLHSSRARQPPTNQVQ